MKSVSKMLGVVGLAVACTNAQPCVSCPAIEGVWFLQYIAPDFPCDAGTPAAPPMTVAFTREGSVVRGAIDGVMMSGTVYDTFDFTLSGQLPNGSNTVNLRGIYRPPTRSDAGDEILYNGVLVRTSAACRDDRRFTGARY